MSLAAFIVFASLTVDVAEARGKLGSNIKATSAGVVNLEAEFVHRLRACNAYATTEPVEIIQHSKGKDKSADDILTKAGALEYKTCRDFAIHLNRGDTIEFTQNKSHVGSFSVASLPQRDALFLLVLHRRSADSKKPAFASHIFTDAAKSAQLAVLDVYNGPEVHNIQIHDLKGKKISRTEDLSYDTVVSISPGDYACALKGKQSGKTVGNDATIQAMHGESYIAMRVGLKSDADFPEEVVVFPNPSGAATTWPGCFSLVMLLLLWQWQ